MIVPIWQRYILMGKVMGWIQACSHFWDLTYSFEFNTAACMSKCMLIWSPFLWGWIHRKLVSVLVIKAYSMWGLTCWDTQTCWLQMEFLHPLQSQCQPFTWKEKTTEYGISVQDFCHTGWLLCGYCSNLMEKTFFVKRKKQLINSNGKSSLH